MWTLVGNGDAMSMASAEREHSEASRSSFISELDPKHLSVSRVQRKRNAKLLHILSASARVLARDGQARFSIRSVAEEAQIRPSSLQYYFETRDQLLLETIRIVIGGYTDRYRIMSARRDLPASDVMALILEDVFHEAERSEIRAFHMEMWALAQHDPAVNALVSGMYEQFRLVLLDVVRLMNDTLTDEQADSAVVLLGSMAEGMVVMYQYGSAGAEPRLQPEIMRQMLQMVETLGRPTANG